MRFFAINGTDRLAGSIAAHGDFECDPCEFREFRNGEHKGRPLVSVRGEDVFVLSYLHGGDGLSANDRLVRLLFFVATCRENGAARVSVLAPMLCYARKDRQTKPYDPVTSKYLAQLFEAAGTELFVTVAAHNLSAFQNAFRCTTLHLGAAELLSPPILNVSGDAPIAVVSPDAGGVKRAQLVREAIADATGRDVGFGVMEKRRSAGVVSGIHFAGAVAGCETWIVDDMIVSGGTMLRAVEACRGAGARSVSLAAAHPLMDVDAAGHLRDAPVDRVVVSDTVPVADGVAELLGAKLVVVPTAPLLAAAVARVRSVS